MSVGAETSQPIGHHEFCETHRSECLLRSPAEGPVLLTEALWAQLEQVNNLVNTAIAPASDLELFGRTEVWVYPATQGDCEDYVLLKRRILIENGWPVSSLLITVVRKPDGEGHAVLTVRTDRGDIILDNLEASIRIWSETPYLYLKRQSDQHTGRWVAISDTRTMVANIAAR
ncbi:MAG: transglutaminase-like cysteine peptidase [Bauldia sp.]|nr:transglutaminase-like cysteine peptidase [Bauldia sp.]MCW5718716.1 transglutaminase-like cysteine peptidase [Bauldia sp.]